MFCIQDKLALYRGNIPPLLTYILLQRGKMSNIRNNKTKPAQKYSIMIRTFVSQPYIHLRCIRFVHGLSEHHVVVIKSGGNIRYPSEKPNIPPAFYHDYVMFRQTMNKKLYIRVYIRLTEEGSYQYQKILSRFGQTFSNIRHFPSLGCLELQKEGGISPIKCLYIWNTKAFLLNEKWSQGRIRLTQEY